MQGVWGRWVSDPLTQKLVVLLVVAAAVAVLVRLSTRAAARRLTDTALRYRVRKLIHLLGYGVVAIAAVSLFAVRLGQLGVALGVAGAGIAFALQEVIASAAGWLAVSFGGFYRTGDRVQLGGIKGDVIDVGVLRTTLMECGQWVNADLYTGRMVRVANSFVFKEPVFNYSGEFPFLWDEIMVPIKYGSDYRLARRILEDVAQEVVGEYARSAEQAWQPVTRRYLIEPASVEPVVSMAANENWIEFTLRFVVDYKLRRATKDALFARILEQVDTHAGQVGIAAATLNIEKVAPLQVRLTGPASASVA